jgi:hypothetical protein
MVLNTIIKYQPPMMQCIPTSVFLSHFGNRANGSLFPYGLKELIHLGLVSKEFHAVVGVSIAKAIDTELSPVGSNLSQLVLNSDISLKGVTILSEFIHAATQTSSYRLRHYDIPLKKVLKRERSNLSNTVKIIMLLHDYFKACNNDLEIDNSHAVAYMLDRYLEIMFKGTQYNKVGGILRECVTDKVIIEKLVHSNSWVPMEEIIKVLQLIQDRQLDLLKVPTFPDYKTFRAHEAVWTTFMTDRVREFYNRLYTGIYYYHLMMCEAVIMQVLRLENIWVVRKKVLHEKFEGLCQRAFSASFDHSAYATELRNVATRVRNCLQQANI